MQRAATEACDGVARDSQVEGSGVVMVAATREIGARGVNQTGSYSSLKASRSRLERYAEKKKNASSRGRGVGHPGEHVAPGFALALLPRFSSFHNDGDAGLLNSGVR